MLIESLRNPGMSWFALWKVKYSCLNKVVISWILCHESVLLPIHSCTILHQSLFSILDLCIEGKLVLSFLFAEIALFYLQLYFNSVFSYIPITQIMESMFANVIYSFLKYCYGNLREKWSGDSETREILWWQRNFYAERALFYLSALL